MSPPRDPVRASTPAAELREREKELDCLYALAELLTRPGLDLGTALAEAARAYAAALERPDLARVVVRAAGLSASFPDVAARSGAEWPVDEESGGRSPCSIRARYASARYARARYASARRPGARRGDKPAADQAPAFRERERLLARSIAALLANSAERLDAEARAGEAALALGREGEALERKNAALSELISRIEDEKRAQRERIRAALESGALGLVARLRRVEDAAEARLLAERLEAGIRSAIGRAEGGGPDPRALLSPREREIAELAAAGLTSKQIAERLSIALSTVERHRHNVRRKLGSPDRRLGIADFLEGR